jgi:hypothetical protein
MTRLSLVAVVALLAACGPGPVPSPTASQAPPTAPHATGGPSETVSGAEPTPTIDPEWIGRPAYSCDGQTRFPPQALEVPAGAENGADEPARLLRSLVREQQGSGYAFPLTGWRRVVDRPDKVVFVAVGPGDPRWFAVAFAKDAGGWTESEYGACDMRVLLPEADLSVADWWIDPQHPIAPDATVVRAFVLETACASGHDAKGRIAAPIIQGAADTIVVIIPVRHRPGGQDCPSNPPTPFTFELPEPLAGRALLDGGRIPPRDATQLPES